MCFSPTASFASSAILMVVGVATLKKAKKENERLFAAIPLLFSGQQFIEGLLWLALLHSQTGRLPFALTQIYAAFAGMIWPTFVPLSMFRIEFGRLRKFFIFIVLAIGYALAAYAFYTITHFGVTSEINRACISYDNPAQPSNGRLIMTAYIVVTCLPFLFASSRILHTIGYLFFIALAVSLYFYKFAFVSIWCFFAGLISSLIYLYFYQEEADAIAHAKSEELLPPISD
jgi:hypothetical protein